MIPIVAKLAGFGGKFLASKGVTLALIAALAGAGGYIAYVMKDRGTLQEQVAQERRNAQSWAEHVEGLRALERRFDAYDRELDAARRERHALARTVDREIEGLRREIPTVDEFLRLRAPPELARVLCDAGTIASTAPECAADP